MNKVESLFLVAVCLIVSTAGCRGETTAKGEQDWEAYASRYVALRANLEKTGTNTLQVLRGFESAKQEVIAAAPVQGNILRALDSSSSTTQLYALAVLSLKPYFAPEIASAVLNLLSSQDREVRVFAALAAGEIVEGFDQTQVSVLARRLEVERDEEVISELLGCLLAKKDYPDTKLLITKFVNGGRLSRVGIARLVASATPEKRKEIEHTFREQLPPGEFHEFQKWLVTWREKQSNGKD